MTPSYVNFRSELSYGITRLYTRLSLTFVQLLSDFGLTDEILMPFYLVSERKQEHMDMVVKSNNMPRVLIFCERGEKLFFSSLLATLCLFCCFLDLLILRRSRKFIVLVYERIQNLLSSDIR